MRRLSFTMDTPLLFQMTFIKGVIYKEMISYKIQDTLFNLFIVISYILLALIISGYKNANNYLQIIDYYVKIIICITLIYKFNRFRTSKFTDLDRKLAYSAGIMLLTTTTINQLVLSKFSKVFFSNFDRFNFGTSTSTSTKNNTIPSVRDTVSSGTPTA